MEVDDLYQIALIAQWQKTAEIQEHNNAEARAYIASRNAIIDYIRKFRGRNLEHMDFPLEAEQYDEPTTLTEPSRILEAKEQLTILYNLKMPHIKALINGLLAGKDKKAIAEEQKVSDSAISQSITRSRKLYA